MFRQGEIDRSVLCQSAMAVGRPKAYRASFDPDQIIPVNLAPQFGISLISHIASIKLPSEGAVHDSFEHGLGT
jgi:hypothetical protein